MKELQKFIDNFNNNSTIIVENSDTIFSTLNLCKSRQDHSLDNRITFVSVPSEYGFDQFCKEFSQISQN